jgi:hypothetical protein
MSPRWHDDVVYLVVMVGLYLVALAVYMMVKRYRRRDSADAFFAKVERWVDGIFAAALVGALVFVTIPYS